MINRLCGGLSHRVSSVRLLEEDRTFSRYFSTTLSLFISPASRNRNIPLSLEITHDANARGIIGGIYSAKITRFADTFRNGGARRRRHRRILANNFAYLC